MNKETFAEIFNKYACSCYEIDRNSNTNFIYGSVLTGGASGGSCWGGTASSYSTGREASEAEVPDLDRLLEEIAPDISFLKYKKLMSEIKWQTTEHCDNDYYGNYSKYGYKYITCDQLFDDMVNAGIFG